MPPSCSLCARSDASLIDEALRAGISYATIETRFGVSHGTLSRHRQHLGDPIISHHPDQEPEPVHLSAPDGGQATLPVHDPPLPAVHDPALAELFTFADEAAFRARVQELTQQLAQAAHTVQTAAAALVEAARAYSPYVVLEHCGVLVSRPTGMPSHTTEEWRRLPDTLQHQAMPELEAVTQAKTTARAQVTEGQQRFYAALEARLRASRALQGAHQAWQRDETTRASLATAPGQAWLTRYHEVMALLAREDIQRDPELRRVGERRQRDLTEQLVVALISFGKTQPPPPGERPPQPHDDRLGPRVPAGTW